MKFTHINCSPGRTHRSGRQVHLPPQRHVRRPRGRHSPKDHTASCRAQTALSTIACFSRRWGNLDRKSPARPFSSTETWTARAKTAPDCRFRLRQQRHHNPPDLRHSLVPRNLTRNADRRRLHPETADEAHHRSSLSSDGRRHPERPWKWLRAACHLTGSAAARHPLPVPGRLRPGQSQLDSPGRAVRRRRNPRHRTVASPATIQ